jgi:hypothetical protein
MLMLGFGFVGSITVKLKGPMSDGPITTAFNFNNLVTLVTFQHSVPLDSNFTSAIR